MNRYPWWKYLIIAVALLVGLIYSLPNLFGEAPAVQLSSGKATLKLDQSAVDRVRTVLTEPPSRPILSNSMVRPCGRVSRIPTPS